MSVRFRSAVAPLGLLSTTEIHARNAKFALRNQTAWGVQDHLRKTSRLSFPENQQSLLHPASLAEGRFAVVTTREAGMRWT
jgi:hypothetical protein